MAFLRTSSPAPLTTEQRFNGASATSAYALSTFDRIVADLDDANGDLVTVEAETAAEIERLTALQTAAARQREQNSNVTANVQRLIAPPVEQV